LAGGLRLEQISVRWKLELGIKISPETIYPYIWANQKSGGVYQFLRTKGKR